MPAPVLGRSRGRTIHDVFAQSIAQKASRRAWSGERQPFYPQSFPMSVTSDQQKCRQLIDRWDEIHYILDPRRLERFALMMDLLEATMPRRFVALDLGAGPGPLSKRIVERFPEARVIAVDHNPVHTRVGQLALEGFGERSQWVTLDLRGFGWDERLPVRRMDAVVTSQTFHDIDAGRLRSVYCTLGARLWPKGVLLNSDWMPWDRSQSRFGRLYEKVAEIKKRDGRQADRLHFHREYMKWWEDAKKVRSLREVFKGVDPLVYDKKATKVTTVEAHLTTLHHAGFRDAGVVWQDGESRVVMARK